MNVKAEINTSEQAQLELLRRLVEAQEDERRRIARELHDQFGQLLTAMALGLQSLRKMDRDHAAFNKQLDHLQILTDEVGQAIHDLALELRPSALDDLGLNAALRQYVDLWSTRTKLTADTHFLGKEDVRLPLELEVATYRIAQEALTNIAKHAQASNVSVIVNLQPYEFSLIIEDDGVGFNAQDLWENSVASGQLGLLGMRERLAPLRGTLKIETNPTQGTTLFVRVPLPVERS